MSNIDLKFVRNFCFAGYSIFSYRDTDDSHESTCFLFFMVSAGLLLSPLSVLNLARVEELGYFSLCLRNCMSSERWSQITVNRWLRFYS